MKSESTGNGEEVDSENRLDTTKESDTAPPDDVEVRADLGSGQEGERDNNQETSKPIESLANNRVEPTLKSDDEVSRRDDEVDKILEAEGVASSTIDHHIAKVSAQDTHLFTVEFILFFKNSVYKCLFQHRCIDTAGVFLNQSMIEFNPFSPAINLIFFSGHHAQCPNTC